MKNLVKRLTPLLPGRVYATRPVVALRAKELGLPDWASLLKTDPVLWSTAKQRAAAGPQVLMATTVGGLAAMSVIESLLSVALTLRGACVHVLLCDRVLPACLRAEKLEVPDPTVFREYGFWRHRLCQECPEFGHRLFDPLELRVHALGDTISTAAKRDARRVASELPFADIEPYRLGRWSVGEHAYAGALRYFASGDLKNEPDGELVVRRYFEGALLTAAAIDMLLRQQRFTAACFSQGIYSPHGIVGEVCRAAGVRVINWNVAYRQHCFIFSHEDTYHHTLLSEPTSAWEDLPWDEPMETAIMDYLKSRWRGTRDWIGFNAEPDEEVGRFAAAAGLDLARPIVGLLTNVMWDAQLHYRGCAFPNMLTWVLETIAYFAARPDLQLLIRVHPAEVRAATPSRQPIVAEIHRAYPRLPKNVFVVPPESSLSTYAAMMRCNAAIIYGTKTGVELTSMGIPVIVAGEAWIRNKGLTLDASSPKEYFEILDRLPLSSAPPAASLERARKYAYHFFFRRMIPLRCVEPVPKWPPYRVAPARLDDLLPGKDPGLDVICDGILSGSPFVYRAESLGVLDA